MNGQSKILRIRSILTVWLVALLILTALVLTLLAAAQRASAADGIQAPLAQGIYGRRFYLATEHSLGSEALSVCDSGFHMASLWETAAVSNLTYDTGRGFTGVDSGVGPPSYISGWVRTGHSASGVITPGLGNCLAWVSSSGSDYGSVAYLSGAWDTDPRIDGTEWTSNTFGCNVPKRVWCVEDLNPAVNVGSYYLTTGTVNGSEVLTACTGGYHTASMWEILDPSNMVYDTSLGTTQADSGEGPPSYPGAHGWVRTGYTFASIESEAGLGNCDGWTSSLSQEYGTRIDLRSDWTESRAIGVWAAYSSSCDHAARVWCARQPIRIYLPAVLRAF
jgi:hypothetical protein